MALKLFKKAAFTNSLSRLFSTTNQNKVTTAGIIVIGDEILKGEVADTNSAYMASELHPMGIQLRKISVIGDEVVEVCKEVKHFSDTYDYVLTTGGIGPTHDDVTYEAAALAFNEPLVLNPQLRDICLRYYKTDDVNCPGMKVAYIPKSARLHMGQKMAYPNVSVKNVYMFPGIPELLIKSFSSLKDTLFISNKRFYSKCAYCNATEDKIVEILDVLVKEYPQVQFGSYPKFNDSTYKVKVTIESQNEELTIKAYERLLKLMPKEYVVKKEEK